MAEEIRTGVYICHCGINIASVVDVAAVAEYAQTLPDVVIARANKYTCSDPGQEVIKSDITNLNLNRVVVAACSPTMHEKTYRRALQAAGLNPYLLEMANIREFSSWCHQNDPKADEATSEIYRKEAHGGIMMVGEFSGMKGADAKEKIRAKMIAHLPASRNGHSLVAICASAHSSRKRKTKTKRTRRQGISRRSAMASKTARLRAK